MTITKERQRERYNTLKYTGICMGCGKTGIPLFYVRCEECRTKANARHKRRFERLKAQGLCSLCGKFPAEDGKTECQNCLDRNRENMARTRKYRDETGLCRACGKPVAPGRKSCEICLSIKRDFEARKRANHPDQKIRERDGFKCRLCGGIGSRIIVHHIDGKGREGRNKSTISNDDPTNLITLCDSCHYRIHKIVRFSQNLDLAIALIMALCGRSYEQPISTVIANPRVGR